MAGLEEAGSWMWLWGQHQLLRDHDRMTADPELPGQEYGTRCFLSALYKLRGASGKVIYLLSTYSCLFVSPASCQYLHLCFLGRDCFAAAFSQAWSEQLRAAFAQVSCSPAAARWIYAALIHRPFISWIFPDGEVPPVAQTFMVCYILSLVMGSQVRL